MKVEDIKWYSPLLFLVGAILSFADPITDILTLVEFYRADHKTWFGVGLAFVILPCLVFALLYRMKISGQGGNDRKCTQTILCGLQPFSAAFARLEGFVVSLKVYYNYENVFLEDVEDLKSANAAELLEIYYCKRFLLPQARHILKHISSAVIIEAVVESGPQFIIQLYAASVQEEPVEVVQIISLCISFLSIAWSITTIDEMLYNDVIGSLKLKLKLAFFLQNLFLATSMLFSYCYFIVSFKWWVIGIPLSNVLLGGVLVCLSKCVRFPSINLSCVYLGRGSEVRPDDSEDSGSLTKMWRLMQLIAICLLVLDNFVMILLFYFSQYSNAWYALPVTICVCVFTVLWCTIRVIIFHLLYNERSNGIVNRDEQREKPRSKLGCEPEVKTRSEPELEPRSELENERGCDP